MLVTTSTPALYSVWSPVHRQALSAYIHELYSQHGQKQHGGLSLWSWRAISMSTDDQESRDGMPSWHGGLRWGIGSCCRNF